MKTRIWTPSNKGYSRCLKSISGDCLEEAGLRIPHGGRAIIDCSIEPRIGDLVWCDNEFGTVHGFIKQVKEFDGETVIVGTAYKDKSKDYTFRASEIYGVVTEAFCRFKESQVYCRKTEKDGAGE